VIVCVYVAFSFVLAVGCTFKRTNFFVRELFKVGSESIQLERKRKFGFIKDVFDEDDGEKTREALSWLQVRYY